MSIHSLIEKKKREKKRQQNLKVAKVAALGTVIGGTLGVASGLLFAPKSGKETREDLKDKSKDVKEYINNNTKIAKEKLSSGLEDGKENLREAKEKISEYLESKRNNGQAVDNKELEVTNEEVLTEDVADEHKDIVEAAVRETVEDNTLEETEVKPSLEV